MLSSLRRYSASEVAQKKMEIINFYGEFGEKATILAFGAEMILAICNQMWWRSNYGLANR